MLVTIATVIDLLIFIIEKKADIFYNKLLHQCLQEYFYSHLRYLKEYDQTGIEDS